MKTDKYYSELDTSVSIVNLEKDIIAKWSKQDTFRKSLKGSNNYVFYDGPPFANGLPHYGHLLTGFIKDTFARYHTMLGSIVERRFGWDCHGLPAEMAAEKELGVSGKIEIEDFGIEKFNQYCRDSVMKYTDEWRSYVNRQARWVDFVNDYKTMDINYMESVIWGFKALHDKGMIYESVRVMPYSWACQTPVSDFETRMDNSYKQKSSKAVTLAVEIIDIGYNLPNLPVMMMIWTTTPWTLPSNLAVAVNKDIEYVAVQHGDKIYLIAEALHERYLKEIGNNVVAKITGAELLGKIYKPVFAYYQDHDNAFRILHGDFVTIENGTGAVHIAPGFGEDDFILCQQNNIEEVCPVDNAGKFTFPITDYTGKHVFDTNDDIIIRLKQQEQWVRTEQYLHNYPHCWRTDTPLIYKAIPSWYVKVSSIRDQMVKNNQQINWIPSHIKDGLFGKWLENARDWSISRNRYWGCPIPVWKSDDPAYPHIEIYGSIAEMEEAFGVEIKDLHRPFIDTLVKHNPSDPTGKSMLRRVPEVLDCWFESGSMPYAQLHYPFENKEKFENNSPADFIVEYIAQTRGWFYTLMVLSTALFDRPPFLNCICHGVILGDGGQKLSKRLKNYADPNEVFDQVGADAMRWFMLSSAVMRGSELVIDTNAIDTINGVYRNAIKPIFNSYSFFSIYANADKIKAVYDITSGDFLDQYIISKCVNAVNQIKGAMDCYDTMSATKVSEEFFEVLTNWYIRRSRERFWGSEINDSKIAAYNTLYSVLFLMCKAIAPLLPLTSEAIFLALQPFLRDEKNDSSVHLTQYPDLSQDLVNEDLIANMDRVRSACNAALRLRNDLGIRIRQPLAKVILIGVAEHSVNEEMKKLVLEEINVKNWENLPKDQINDYANFKIKLNLPLIGKRLPQHVKDLLLASKSNQWINKEDGTLHIAGIDLLPEEFLMELEPKLEYAKVAVSLHTNDALIILDTDITEELKEEGSVRDLVRMIQQSRKDLDLEITARITLFIESEASYIQRWKSYIEKQTLSHIVDALKQDLRVIKVEEYNIDDETIKLSIIV